jgi:putative PIN family toxin of toxin-antitoxin system
VTSVLILKELATVLRRPKFKTSEDEIHIIILSLIQSSEIASVTSRFEVVKQDPQDDIVINAAYDGCADIIGTGDRHLLELESLRGIKLFTVGSLLELL